MAGTWKRLAWGDHGHDELPSPLDLLARDGVSEGGRLVLRGAGTNPNWTMDIFGAILRFYATLGEATTVDWMNYGGGLNFQINGNLALQQGANINEFSTDGTLAGNSDLAVPTEKAVKAYVDANGGGAIFGDSYVDAGSKTTWDVQIGGLINDGAWHNLDLKPFGVPADAKLVNMYWQINGTANSFVWLAHGGNTAGELNASTVRVKVTGIESDGDVCLRPVNGVIAYRIINNPTAVNVAVRGWFIPSDSLPEHNVLIGDKYVDRGVSEVETDFRETDLTIDGAWHVLDFSSIVPVGTTAVRVRFAIRSTTMASTLGWLNRTGFNDGDSSLSVYTQTVGGIGCVDGEVLLDENRRCQVLISTGVTDVWITVRGWYVQPNPAEISGFAEISDDVTLGDNSAGAVPTEHAVKTYVDNHKLIAGHKFIDRGPVATADFIYPTGLTADGAMRSLSLQGIIPLDAVMVLLRVSFKTNTIGEYCSIGGGTGDAGVLLLRTVAAGAYVDCVCAIQVREAETIYYRLSTVTTGFQMHVMGWWVPPQPVEAVAELCDDPTLASNAHDEVPSVYAVKGYVDSQGGGGGFVPIAGVTSPQFTSASFTCDNAWHTLDLSSLVPEGTKLVKLIAFARHQTVSGSKFWFAKTSTSSFSGIGTAPAAAVNFAENFLCEVNTDRTIAYKFDSVAWGLTELFVVGYWT